MENLIKTEKSIHFLHPADEQTGEQEIYSVFTEVNCPKLQFRRKVEYNPEKIVEWMDLEIDEIAKETYNKEHPLIIYLFKGEKEILNSIPKKLQPEILKLIAEFKQDSYYLEVNVEFTKKLETDTTQIELRNMLMEKFNIPKNEDEYKKQSKINVLAHAFGRDFLEEFYPNLGGTKEYDLSWVDSFEWSNRTKMKEDKDRISYIQDWTDDQKAYFLSRYYGKQTIDGETKTGREWMEKLGFQIYDKESLRDTLKFLTPNSSQEQKRYVKIHKHFGEEFIEKYYNDLFHNRNPRIENNGYDHYSNRYLYSIHRNDKRSELKRIDYLPSFEPEITDTVKLLFELNGTNNYMEHIIQKYFHDDDCKNGMKKDGLEELINIATQMKKAQKEFDSIRTKVLFNKYY